MPSSALDTKEPLNIPELERSPKVPSSVGPHDVQALGIESGTLQIPLPEPQKHPKQEDQTVDSLECLSSLPRVNTFSEDTTRFKSRPIEVC